MRVDAPAGNSPAGPSRRVLVLAFAAIYLIWGSTYLGIRVAVETMPPFLMAGARFFVSGLVLFIYLLARGGAWPTVRQWRDQAIVGIFLLLGGNAIVAWAELHTPSGITCLVLGSSPIVVIFMDWLRPHGQRPTLPLLVGVVIGVGGIALLLDPGSIPAGYRPPVIDLIALWASSICWWIGSFYSKHSAAKTPLLMASAMQMLCGCGSILLMGWILGEGRGFHTASVSRESWLAFFYLVVVGGIVAFPVYAWLLENSTPAKVSTFAYVNPVVAVVLGWALLGEPLTPRMLFATGIIVGAVAIISFIKTRPSPKG